MHCPSSSRASIPIFVSLKVPVSFRRTNQIECRIKSSFIITFFFSYLNMFNRNCFQEELTDTHSVFSSLGIEELAVSKVVTVCFWKRMLCMIIFSGEFVTKSPVISQLQKKYFWNNVYLHVWTVHLKYTPRTNQKLLGNMQVLSCF